MKNIAFALGVTSAARAPAPRAFASTPGPRSAGAGRGLLTLCIALVVAMGACATERETRRGDELVCPEFRDLTCLGEPVCRMTDRGCKSCQCPAVFQNRNGSGFPVDPPSR